MDETEVQGIMERLMEPENLDRIAEFLVNRLVAEGSIVA